MANLDAEARIPDIGVPRVVVVGGGFGGIELVKGLRKAKVQVVLFDKSNHHTFQPLLYQVATAGLEASSIIYPFRKCFEDQKNFYFRLGEVLEVKNDTQIIETSIGSLRYDYLVLATGATTNFYGMKDIEKNAIPLKNITDALMLRNTVLNNIEKALLTSNYNDFNALLDIVIVGGGPTGVEVAGALAELKQHVFPRDYPELDLSDMNIYLVSSSDRLLDAMPQKASDKALEYLESMGVDVKLSCAVNSYDGNTARLSNGEQLSTRCLMWGAGVKGAPVKGIPEGAIWRGGRIITDAYNTVLGMSNVFAIGDAGAIVNATTPQGHPMMAPAAMQQGALLAKNIQNMMQNKPLKPFVYNDQGSMATVGRNKAVVDLKAPFAFRGYGFIAWCIWMFVHLISIIGFKNKIMTVISWMVSYFSYDKGNRLILPIKREQTIEQETLHRI